MKRRTFIKKLSYFYSSLITGYLITSLNIKEKFDKIQKIDISDESTEGGTITCFISNKNISKVLIEQCWESGRYSLLFLFKRNGNLHEANEIEIHYNRPFIWTKELAVEIGDNEFFDEHKSHKINRKYFFQNNLIVDFYSSDKEAIDLKALKKIEHKFNKRIEFIKKRLLEKNIIV